MKHRTQKRFALAATVLALVVLTTAQWLRAGHVFGNDQRLIVWFFDVGQGDSIFIESPTGKQILVDGGPGHIVLDKLSAVMPFWDRSLDAVLVTHPHLDHLSGLVDVVDRYHVETVYQTGIMHDTLEASEFERRVSDDEQVVNVVAPMAIDLGGGVTLQIIYPTHSLVDEKIEDLNQSSIVALLTCGETSILLTGDETAEEEPTLIQALNGPIDVLKVGHHGSAYSSTEAFLQFVDPNVAVISVGEGNDYGHPSLLTLKRLADIGAAVLRTDQDGDIRLISDGGEPTLSRWSL